MKVVLQRKINVLDEMKMTRRNDRYFYDFILLGV